MHLLGAFLKLLLRKVIAFCHSQQLFIPTALYLVITAWQLVTHTTPWAVRHPWTPLFPYITISVGLIATQVIAAARDLNRNLAAEASKNVSPLILPNGKPVPNRVPSKKPGRFLGSCFFAGLLLLEGLALRAAYPSIPGPPMPVPPGLPETLPESAHAPKSTNQSPKYNPYVELGTYI